MPTSRTYAVIGAGHGGKAMAAHLALLGCQVTLYNRTAERVAAIKARGGIDLENADGPRGFGRIACVTSDMAEALADADLVMVVVPSSAHADIAKAAAPHLRDGQIVVLHPGRTLGAIEFDKVLRDHGCRADVTVAEAETFIYASRSDGPAQARIFRIKEAVPVAALPATRTPRVLDALAARLPAVHRRHQRAAHRPQQHGRHLSPGADPAERRAASSPHTATISSTSTA